MTPEPAPRSTLATTPSRRALLAAALGTAAGALLPRGTVAAAQSPSDGLTDLERQEPERLLAVVSRTRPVDPLDYVPPDLVRWRDGPYELRAEVAEHLGRLVDDAAAAGLGLRVISGFRSYRTQAETHASWVRRRGRRAAEAVSARPGHSEHQTGLAVDVDSTDGFCYLDACFGDTPEGRWVGRHAHRHGFVLSFPRGTRHRTGITYEPWHLRYVGPTAAGRMRRWGVALLADYVSAPHASAGLGTWLGGPP